MLPPSQILGLHAAFKMQIDDLHPALHKFAASGSIFFYTFGNRTSSRHIQLMDGTIICGKKPRFADGSIDIIEYNGTDFIWHEYDAHGAKFGHPFQDKTIRNPISCKACKKWFDGVINNSKIAK